MKAINGMVQPILRFRLHGLRKLNWSERCGADYLEHAASNGFDGWLEPGPLAIVVGPNGGGKTTIIDLFRALADATIWPGLARENYPGDDFSGFDIEGAFGTLSGRFSKFTPDAQDTFEKLTLFAIASRGGAGAVVRALAPKYAGDDGWARELQNLLDREVGVRVRYLPATTGVHPASALSDDELAERLVELSEHFPSVMANPRVKPFSVFRGLGDARGRIGVLFKDDAGQHAFVHRSALPSGWLQLAEVLHFLRACGPGDLILLDEPDRHLHPSLQRVLLEIVARERRRLDAQVILATHSSVLVNPELCERVSARVLVAARGRCEMLTDARRILDDLGVTSGDLVQANGVIWVEGPSDRIYVKHWLDLWAAHAGKNAPIERVHYAFVSYGGALMKHVSLSHGSPDRVDLRSVNRNFALVADRDLSERADGRLAGDKGRLLDEAAALSAESAIWITAGYTIEAYLPEDWSERGRHVITDAAGRLRVQGIGKVDLARRFVEAHPTWTGGFCADSDLPERIALLFDRIVLWQSPQETIVPTYLPPFLIDP